MEKLVDEITQIQKKGIESALVSSGAVGAGLDALKIDIAHQIWLICKWPPQLVSIGLWEFTENYFRKMRTIGQYFNT